MKKVNLVLLIVGACLFAGGIIGIIVGTNTEQTNASPIIYIFLGTVAFTGFIFIIVTLVYISNEKAAEKNLNNPTSICYRTYGGHEDFKLFRGYINKAANTAKNAAINAAGVIGVIFGVGGVFVTGQTVFDIFVSDTELIINDKRKNGRMNDGGFFVYSAQSISNLSTNIDGNSVSVHIDFNSKIKSFTLDIPVKNKGEINSVTDSFARLISPAPDAIDNYFIPLFE